MKNLEAFKATATRVVGRTSLIAKKYTPEILTAVGVVGIVASTVMACKATLKAEDVISEANQKLEKIHYAQENIPEEEYSNTDYKHDLTIAYVQTGVGFVKLYGPSVALGVASIACILGAHNIMRKRNLALVAAYNAVSQGFDEYRKRVVDELGVEKDKQFRYGVKDETITVTETSEDGKKKKVKETVQVVDPNANSIYARFFDEYNPNWQKNPEYNLLFLKAQQNYFNDLLHARGHVFLNEVYDGLGIDHSEAGAVTGWVMGEDNSNFIDFGIWDFQNERARAFVNGYEPSILLDFNVTGVIYNLI